MEWNDYQGCCLVLGGRRRRGTIRTGSIQLPAHTAPWVPFASATDNNNKYNSQIADTRRYRIYPHQVQGAPSYQCTNSGTTSADKWNLRIEPYLRFWLKKLYEHN